MSTMTAKACAADEWTAGYTAAADGTITIQNTSTSAGLRVRIDAAATVNDALTDPHFYIMPGEIRAFPVKNGDEVFLAPLPNANSAPTVKAIVLA